MRTSANAAQRIGRVLARYPLAHRTASLGVQALAYTVRARQIATYLAAHEHRYLRIGSGSHTDPGWLSVDLLPVARDVVFMDATKRFPLPPQSFDAIQCEHVIEHVDHAAGQRMLAECHRVLSPGGILRIATPNLELVRRLLDRPRSDPCVISYVQWSNETFGTAVERTDSCNAAFTANRLMRQWGHTFLYDERTLRLALAGVGFSEITRVRPGDSAHVALRGVDRHAEEVGAAANELETLALEATA